MATHSRILWEKRLMESLRRYTYLHGRGRRSNCMRIAKVALSNGKGILLGWKLKAVPRLRLRVVRSAAKSWVTRIKDAYLDMVMGFARTIRLKPARRMAVQDFNTKVVIEMYKSLGIQVQACQDPSPKTARLVS